MPEVVKQHYLAKPGYVNYFFNQLNRDRMWKALVARGDYAPLRGAWTVLGQAPMNEEVRFELSDTLASIKLPSGELKIELTRALSERLDPPGSGGLLVALSMWRRFLIEGPEKFGDVYYLGTAPLAGRDRLMDVLVATHGDVECRFLFDPTDGQLAGMPSQLFDAVAIVLSDAGCATLLKQAAAAQWAMDAFGHLKAIGASKAARPLLDKAGVVPDAGVTDLGGAFVKAAAQRFYDREPSLRDLA